jgi:hypothetical protein
MAKKFTLLTTAKSTEVSLCSKYNSGANKQTEFEIVKDEQGATDRNMKPVIENLVKFIDFYGEPTAEVDQDYNAFKDFLNYWLEYDINCTYYNLLSEALQSALSDIKYKDIPKEDKVQEYQNLFNMFIEEYKTLPITKTQDGKYEVSLVSKSHIQEVETNPQNETVDITKEKTSEMEKQEQLTLVEKAFDLIKSAFGLEKSETPAEEQPEVQPEETTEEKPEIEEAVEAPAEEAPVEKTEETVEETVEEPAEEAEVEAPVVEEEVKEEPAETEEPAEEEAPVEKTSETVDVEALIKAKADVEAELEALKKSNEAKEIEIEKMSFVQKAKDEFSMLVGTPEEIGEKLYTISKSNLETEVKDFVFEQLKKVAKENAELTEEVGSITKNAGDMTDEDVIYAKAEELAKAKNISINQALRQIQ